MTKSGFASTRGLRWHYVEWGEETAPPVVLLHGTTSNAHSWDKLCPILARRYRCIAFDWLNHGDSDTNDNAGLWDQHADDLLGLVNALGLDTFGLIGLSMGGRAALGFTGQWPERVNRLVVEDMAPHITSVGSEGARRYQRNSALEFDSWDDLFKWHKRARPYSDAAWVEEQTHWNAVSLSGGRYGVKYRPGTGSVANTPELAGRLWGLLPSISCPALILRGGKSPILDDEITNRMVETIPDCRAEIVPDAGHMVHEDNPAVALPLISRFFGVEP